MALLGAVTTIASGINLGGISFKEPSEKKAARVLPSVVQSALSGNLTAWKCLDERRTRAGIVKEREVWIAGWQQVATARPDLLATYEANKDKIPAINHTSPEAAAQSALANPFTAPSGPARTTPPSTPPLNKAFNGLERTGSNMPLWLVLALAGVAGWAVYKAVRK